MMILKITRSQHMALIDILLDHVQNSNVPHEFVDCSEDPPITTIDHELLSWIVDTAVEEE
jgi:hypothetical protein